MKSLTTVLFELNLNNQKSFKSDQSKQMHHSIIIISLRQFSCISLFNLMPNIPYVATAWLARLQLVTFKQVKIQDWGDGLKTFIQPSSGHHGTSVSISPKFFNPSIFSLAFQQHDSLSLTLQLLGTCELISRSSQRPSSVVIFTFQMHFD